MKDNKLYTILDLIEEITNVDKMIELHKNSGSELMLNQYIHQKLKLSNYLFKELLTNAESKPEVMYLIKAFIEKFYKQEIEHPNFENNDALKKIEKVFM